jgi:hypothetical protein
VKESIMLTEEERHTRQHEGLARMQERIDRIEAHALANARRLKMRGIKKYVKRQSYSQRVSQYHAWRAHLRAHGVKVPTFATFDELLALHDQDHKH